MVNRSPLGDVMQILG